MSPQEQLEAGYRDFLQVGRGVRVVVACMQGAAFRRVPGCLKLLVNHTCCHCTCVVLVRIVAGCGCIMLLILCFPCFIIHQQAPLQPLQDNLESQTYETFEKDVTKYACYQAAVAAALTDRVPDDKVDSVTTVLMVVGAGGVC